MTAPVLAPPPVLTDSHGLRWIYAGMSELGPAYLPQQSKLFTEPPALPVREEWAEVYVTGEGE